MKPKILVSLVTASISALALAPEIQKELEKENSSEKSKENKIDINDVLLSLQNDELKEYREQMSVLVNKKAPLTKLGDNVIIMAENYVISNDETIKDNIIQKNLKKSLEEAQKDLTEEQKQVVFGLSDSTWLSTWTTPGNATTTGAIASETSMVCHGSCHTACHGACHGARGWR